MGLSVSDRPEADAQSVEGAIADELEHLVAFAGLGDAERADEPGGILTQLDGPADRQPRRLVVQDVQADLAAPLTNRAGERAGAEHLDEGASRCERMRVGRSYGTANP